jgi:aspartate kinase
VVDEDEIVEKQVVSGIAYSRDEAKITLTTGGDRPASPRPIFGPLADALVNVDMIVQNSSEDGKTTDMTFTSARPTSTAPVKLLDEAQRARSATRT